MKTYNWATYGTGVIANQLAQAMASQGRKLYSVSNRTYAKGVAFAEKYNISKIYNNPEDVFTDENVDIIYISTPHNTHLPLLLKALANGKHVLCEKSITLNSDELAQAITTAESGHAILAEAMTIYHMPLYKKLHEIAASGELGPLRMIQMNFGSYKEYDMANRFFNRNLAGGAMLDIGVYALSFVRWFMSSAPDQILSQGKLAPTLSLHAKQPKRGLVIFEKGYIEVYEYPRAEKAVITYTESGKKETIEAGNTADALLYEVLDMEAAVSGEKDVTETMHLDYTKDVMQVMTKCREDWGMKYPEEECYR